MYSLGDYVMVCVGGLIVLAVAFFMFVLMPVSLAADAKCLESGYPKAAVTWNLKKYCMNLDGSVTVRVDEIE